MNPEIWAIIMFVVTFGLIFLGCPVAFALGGSAFLFFVIGIVGDYFQFSLFELMGNRLFGIMSNGILLAIPYFIFMGTVLQRSKLAEDMLSTIGKAFGSIRGGLGITVIVVGALLAASTSIVAASVVAMGLISMPTMLNAGYSKEYASGVIVAAGTLGQIIPPGIVLIVLADQMGISVGDVFKGALIPGVLLAFLYIVYTFILGKVKPHLLPPLNEGNTASKLDLLKELVLVSMPPLLLIIVVLGSIFGGVATPSEAGALGAIAAIFLAFSKERTDSGNLRSIKASIKKVIQKTLSAAKDTVTTTSMVMFLLIGSTAFALVFRGFYGDKMLEQFLVNLPGGELGFIVFSGLFVFILGFFIDFFEITFIVVPFLVPAAQLLGIDLVWLAIIISLNMQTSFLTPPFGFSLFFLRGVAPPEVSTQQIFRGAIPFVVIQIFCMCLVYLFPKLVTWIL